MDDALADRVLAGEDIEQGAIWPALRRGTLAGRFFPCFGGSGPANQGVQPLLDGVRGPAAGTARPPAGDCAPPGRRGRAGRDQ